MPVISPGTRPLDACLRNSGFGKKAFSASTFSRTANTTTASCTGFSPKNGTEGEMTDNRIDQLLDIWRTAGLLPVPGNFNVEADPATDAAYWKWADQRILLCALSAKIATYGT